MGKCGNELASMAKYWTTELENKVAADCLQLHGGWGFMWETQIAKAYASARVQVAKKIFPKNSFSNVIFFFPDNLWRNK